MTILVFEDIHALLSGAVCAGQKLKTYVMSSILRTQVPSRCGKSNAYMISKVESVLISIDEALQDLSKLFTDVSTLLRRHRNSLVNINTMPDEILLPIFRTATPDVKYKYFVMHTCTRWQDICLSSPRFWAEFTLPNTKRDIIKYLKEMAWVDLDLTIDCPSFWEKNQAAFWECEPRLRQLSLLNFSLKPENTEWLMSSWPPEVQTLLIDGGIAHSSWADCLVTPLLSNKVSEMTLINCRIPYHPEQYCRLRKLCIDYHSLPLSPKVDSVLYYESYPSTMDGHLIDVLASCPDLVDLTLRHPPISASEATSHPAPSLPPATPQFLRHLSLSMYMQTIGAVLENIATSAHTLSTIHIAVTDMKHWVGRERNHELLRGGFSMFSSIPRRSIPALERLHSLSLCYGRSMSGRGPPTALSAAALDFRITFGTTCKDDDMERAFESFLDFMLAHSFLQNVRDLRLAGFRNRARTLRVLRAVPHVKSLTLDASCGEDVLWYIAQRRAHSTRPLVPELESVRLAGCVVSDDFLGSLSVLLAELHIGTLVLDGCDSALGDGEIVQRLRENGLDVQWVEDNA